MSRVYETNNAKAIAFGESHLSQVNGRIKLLTAEYESMRDNGFRLGGVAKRHQGMTATERRAAILDERKEDILRKKEESWILTRVVEDLKNLMTNTEDLDDSFVEILCRADREEIARLTGYPEKDYRVS